MNTPKSDPPVDGPPIALSPATFARHEGAARYVEAITRTRAPRPSRERSPGLAPGAWGYLPAGTALGARSGLTLGAGSLQLYRADPSNPRALTATGESVTVYNPGAAIVAPAAAAMVLPMVWNGGAWIVPETSGSVTFKFALTDQYGVPKRSGLTPGSATVTLYDLSSGSLVLTSDTETALNVALDAVAGSVLVGLAWVDGNWVVVWEDCTSY